MNKWVAAGVVLAGVMVSNNPVSAALESGYGPLADWSSLPRVPADTAGMGSSYDRGGNTTLDYNNYDTGSQVAGGTVRDITGPGVVTRFWMPHYASNPPSAAVKLTIDGTVYNTTSDALFNGMFGTSPQFQAPLVTTLIGGRVSYEPITFQNSMKIEMSTGGRAVFYQWEYRKYGAASSVPSFNGGPTAAQQAARTKSATALNNVGQNPAGADPSALTSSQSSISIPANGTVTLANVSGSGQVRSLLLNLRGGTGNPKPTQATLDGLVVRVRYDGSATNAIDIPVSRFFGVGQTLADYKSLPLGVADDGSYYSHWPMPYRQGVTIELHNSTGSAIAVPSATVEYKPGAVSADTGYLYAKRTVVSRAADGGRVNLLTITGGGAGQYMGNLLSVSGANGILEGNDIITADGNELHGTGLEDAYNGGYYYNHAGSTFDVSDHGDVVNPTSGTTPLYGLLNFGGFTATDQYRWRITDAVPFTGSLTVDMESFGFAAGTNSFDSTAFYYQVPEPGAAGLAAGAAILLLRRRKA